MVTGPVKFNFTAFQLCDFLYTPYQNWSICHKVKQPFLFPSGISLVHR